MSKRGGHLEGISKEQLRAILTKARARGERDWLMVLTTFHHGLRCAELLDIRREDIAGGYVTIRAKKQRKKKRRGKVVTPEAPSTEELMKHPDPLWDERFPLEIWASKCAPGTPVFRISKRQWERIFKKLALEAGVPDHLAHPHTLRHTTARFNIPAGVHHVQKVLRQKSLQSAGAYLNITTAEADAAKKRIVRSL